MSSLVVKLRTWMTGLVLCSFAAGSFAGNCSDANPAALEWLDKMSRSSHEVNYHGVVTFERGDNMQVMQVSHSVDNGTASESMTQLTGQGAQVVRVDHPLHCVHPGHRLLRLGAELQAGHCGIAEHYRFQVGQGDRIAGRRAVKIEIEARDMYRYGYVMELDKETGLLLRLETRAHGKKTLERFQFANLSFTESAANAVDMTDEVAVVHHANHPPAGESGQQNFAADRWGIGWLPSGFLATDPARGEASRKTFTDGLAVFSVFLEKLPREIHPGEGVARRGGTTSYTRGMGMSGESVLVTVIGEVPLNTARMVADSVLWSSADVD